MSIILKGEHEKARTEGRKENHEWTIKKTYGPERDDEDEQIRKSNEK